MGPRHFLFAASRKETIGGLLRPMYFHAPPSTPLVGKKLLLTPFNLPDVHKLHAGPPSAAQAFGRYGQRYIRPHAYGLRVETGGRAGNSA